METKNWIEGPSYVVTISKNMECRQSRLQLNKANTIKVLARMLAVQPLTDTTRIVVSQGECHV